MSARWITSVFAVGNAPCHTLHLRNAILGDTFARLLRRDQYKSGYEVGVQNYIDNTGVQVADVVVGLVHLEGRTLDSVQELLISLREGGEYQTSAELGVRVRTGSWAEPLARLYLDLTDPHDDDAKALALARLLQGDVSGTRILERSPAL